MRLKKCKYYQGQLIFSYFINTGNLDSVYSAFSESRKPRGRNGPFLIHQLQTTFTVCEKVVSAGGSYYFELLKTHICFIQTHIVPFWRIVSEFRCFLFRLETPPSLALSLALGRKEWCDTGSGVRYPLSFSVTPNDNRLSLFFAGQCSPP